MFSLPAQVTPGSVLQINRGGSVECVMVRGASLLSKFGSGRTYLVQAVSETGADFGFTLSGDLSQVGLPLCPSVGGGFVVMSGVTARVVEPTFL